MVIIIVVKFITWILRISVAITVHLKTNQSANTPLSFIIITQCHLCSLASRISYPKNKQLQYNPKLQKYCYAFEIYFPHSNIHSHLSEFILSSSLESCIVIHIFYKKIEREITFSDLYQNEEFIVFVRQLLIPIFFHRFAHFSSARCQHHPATWNKLKDI